MLKAAGRAGVPQTLLRYIESLYRGTMIQLKVDGYLREVVTVLHGVRQGDPL